MKRLLLTTLALLALALTPAIHAQATALRTTASRSASSSTPREMSLGDLFSDSVSSWQLMVSYMFMEHLGVEGSYGEDEHDPRHASRS